MKKTIALLLSVLLMAACVLHNPGIAENKKLETRSYL